MFTLYQPNLDKFVENGNFKSDDLAKKHFDITFRGNVTPSDLRNYYGAPVANIDAKDLDECFEIGNIGPEAKIERLSRMASVSVGDILVGSHNGKHYVVKSFGFEELN
jgi:hypothetical protein